MSRAKEQAADMLDKAMSFTPEPALLSDLRPHPRNYKQHPEDQLNHIRQSIREHGLYRNIVIARDNTILAGHGVVQALQSMGEVTAPVIRLPIEPESAAALKVLAGDNEIGHLAERDDRLFTEILKQIKDVDVESGLLGTGFDDMMLANLLFITRPEHEIADINEAAEWVGMPEYSNPTKAIKLTVMFESEADRDRFCEEKQLTIRKKEAAAWQTVWPHKPYEDLKSVKFEKASAQATQQAEESGETSAAH